MKRTLLVLAAGALAFVAWHVQRGGNTPDARIEPAMLSNDKSTGKQAEPVSQVELAEGGMPESEVPEKYHETIQKGLSYLARHQHKDGHWEGDDGKHPVAMTGLVGLALLMERVPPRREARSKGESKYHVEIHKAVSWLKDKSKEKRDGLIFSGHPSETNRYMEGHGLATIFLTGAMMPIHDETRKELRDVLVQSVNYIAKAQSSQRGWYHTSKVEGHDFDAVGPTAIQIQALIAADSAGIPVPPEAISDAKEYLKAKINKSKSTDKVKPRLTETAAMILCCSYLVSPRIMNRYQFDEFKSCEAELPKGRDVQFGRDELVHYYFAQAAFLHSEPSWLNYRNAMFDHLQATQRKDGSWPPGDGLGVGSVYSTAIWCVIMQLARDRHPSLRVIQLAID